MAAFSGSQRSVFNEDVCIQYDQSKPNILLIGDSHASHYYRALSDLSSSINFSQVNASGCKPTIVYSKYQVIKKTDELYKYMTGTVNINYVSISDQICPNSLCKTRLSNEAPF